jgi:Chaperone of endosialidase
MKTISHIIYAAFALFAFACFALLQNAQAVVPPPDGGYANRNTAEGQDALFSLTTGTDNTAIGFNALINNTTGSTNTATGSLALNSNTTALANTAVGYQALYSNTSGGGNNAFGTLALSSNISGIRNLAVGSGALGSLTSGDLNVAVGNIALFQGVTVNFNTALGRGALFRSQGDQNVGLGFFAGANLSDGGTNNIYIGNAGPVPIGTESNTIRIGTQTATTVTAANETHAIPAHTATFIAGISGAAVTGSAVLVSSSGQLGVRVSSARFKDEIKPMDEASEAILALKPVAFRYKKEVDAERTPQFGLVAEQVETVNPDLVTRDPDGKAFTVRYEAVNAMLLNEFLKEHKTVQEQGATIAELKSIAAKQETINTQQQREIKALAATLREQASQIQKVSAQLELEKAPAQPVVNNQ